MTSNIHEKILDEKIKDYRDKGYDLISRNKKICYNYRPDAVVENKEKVVVIEVVISSSNTNKLKKERLRNKYNKPVILDVEDRSDLSSRVIKVDEEAFWLLHEKVVELRKQKEKSVTKKGILSKIIKKSTLN